MVPSCRGRYFVYSPVVNLSRQRSVQFGHPHLKEDGGGRFLSLISIQTEGSKSCNLITNISYYNCCWLTCLVWWMRRRNQDQFSYGTLNKRWKCSLYYYKLHEAIYGSIFIWTWPQQYILLSQICILIFTLDSFVLFKALKQRVQCPFVSLLFHPNETRPQDYML